jgi:CheY-like chemotaxis protein
MIVLNIKSMTTPYHIFYTDDDKDDREIFSSVVEEIGSHNLHLQKSGDELLTALKNPPPTPHMIFLDLNMPGKSGFDVMEEISSGNAPLKAPIIVFSTSDDEESIMRAKGLGASMYVVKPGSFSCLKSAITNLLSMNWHASVVTGKPFLYQAN